MSPRPEPFPCGGENQPPCPPQPAAVFSPSTLADENFPVYSRREHLAYGKQCWDAGAEHVIKMDKDEAAYMPKGDKS